MPHKVLRPVPPSGKMARQSYWFQAVCEQNGFSIDYRQKSLLESYANLLLEWNKKVNLISRRDELQLWPRHILHAAALFYHISVVPTAKILDLGTGGGLPGIPIRILLPKSEVTLIDSIRKKTLAVQDIIERLSIEGIRVVCGRAEELGKQKEFHAQFDYVVARGVATLRELIKWSSPFLKPRDIGIERRGVQNGKLFVEPPALVAMKGGDLEREIAAVEKNKRVRELAVISLTIRGLDDPELAGKKAVVVRFNSGE